MSPSEVEAFSGVEFLPVARSWVPFFSVLGDTLYFLGYDLSQTFKMSEQVGLQRLARGHLNGAHGC